MNCSFAWNAKYGFDFDSEIKSLLGITRENVERIYNTLVGDVNFQVVQNSTEGEYSLILL